MTARIWWYVAQGGFAVRQFVATEHVSTEQAPAAIARATGDRVERAWPFRRGEDVVGERYRHGRRA